MTAARMRGNLTRREAAPLTALKTGSAAFRRLVEMEKDEREVVGAERVAQSRAPVLFLAVIPKPSRNPYPGCPGWSRRTRGGTCPSSSRR